jgi:hypothetical protein
MKRFLTFVMSTAVVVVSISLLSGCDTRQQEHDKQRYYKETQENIERIEREKEEAIALAARVAEQDWTMGATSEEVIAQMLQENDEGDNDHPDLQ